LVTTGICRYLARQGLRVAPFKAQNMSNNSMVCRDGAEIGRAQYLQAQAARAEPESAMNPVLLKPGSDRRSHVVLRGRPDGELAAGEFATGRKHLAAAAFAAYRELAEKYDVIVCEGAGSPAEINLRSGDYVNMGLARRFELPVLVVGDIDRGGVFASLFGTVGLLDADDRALIKAFVINKFRGDESLLRPGLDQLTALTGVPFLGVLPWLPDMWLDGEDTLLVGRWAAEQSPSQSRSLNVAAVRFPRLCNATDLDALACEPGVSVTVTTDPVVLRSADVIVLPGSRATVSDLLWLRRNGLADEVMAAAAAGRTVVGICGGYQMLARSIDDPVESKAGLVEGLGLLPTAVKFGVEKHLSLTSGSWRGLEVSGYEIHHGVAQVDASAEPFLDGCRQGSVWGTAWHGTFENDDFRRAFLASAAVSASVPLSAERPSGAMGFAQRREMMIDRLADAVDAGLDTDRLLSLLGR
jgi:adenosylcobyric acid synthase